MKLKLVEFTEPYAKEICGWKYEDEYSIYNYPEWNKAYNERAIKCYKKAGFRIKEIYEKNTSIGYGEFIKMTLSF